MLTHGTSRLRRGGEVVYMDQVARRRARADLGRTAYAQFERALDAYLVVGGDGVIFTCAHRCKGKLRAA